MSFEKLNLDERLLKAVEACGFETPTPIQAKAIPIILEGGDVMGSAQTGTGKTAAFVLPILHQLITRKPVKKSVGPRCLVVAPTRELAQQVEKDATALSKFIKFTQGSVVGGVSYGPQIQIWTRPLDLLIATPGRLLDHMGQGRIDFSRLEFLVLDEADRMLDMGFIGDIRKIVAAVPEKKADTVVFRHPGGTGPAYGPDHPQRPRIHPTDNQSKEPRSNRSKDPLGGRRIAQTQFAGPLRPDRRRQSGRYLHFHKTWCR
jgi:superfamily II DNA/RNA helicase